MGNRLKYAYKEAALLDSSNELARFRERFHIPPATIYMDGNSLGLLSRDAEKSLMRLLDEWRELGIGGWMDGSIPWFWYANKIGNKIAPLVGARSGEVIFSGSTTVNIHTLAGSFYRPVGERTVIIADELNFPSDLYALKGLLKLKGMDPGNLILAGANPEGLLDEERIISHMNEQTALVFLPSVLYRSGQLLDIEKLASAANERNIPIGFDLSHSAGVIPHRLSDWGVDFALWCSYKYLNGGPGAPAFLYVNEKNFGLDPALPGWFGSDKEKQFKMSPDFIPAPDAGRWQISSTCILGSAPLEGAMDITLEAGIDTIRKVSLQLTGFLQQLLKEELLSRYPEMKIITPSLPGARGGHIAISHPEAAAINEALLAEGIITDLRPPDVIRIAPVPLYNTFDEVCRVIESLMTIMESQPNDNSGPGKKL